MRILLFIFEFFCLSAVAQVGVGPLATALAPPLPEPRDHLFQGRIELRVDATDTVLRVFRVNETIPLQGSGDLVLLYPEWDPASHGPTASAAELAGLQMRIDGHSIGWQRDTVNIHAFHLTVPTDARTLTLSFEYLPPRTLARLRPDMLVVEWQRLLLYPAGWYTRNISIAAELQIPQGLQAFTSLAPSGSFTPLRFAPETLDRLVDAPVYAARYVRQIELAPSPSPPVHLDLLADKPGDLSISTKDLNELQALIVQTSRVFGPAPFRHYDMVVSLSDVLSPGGGIEHLDEGENNLPANYFTAGDQQLNNRDLIAHEYVHSWNGRSRQPDGLWSPSFNRPTDPSMLWVYEGQTEFWGRVFAARAKLRTLQETLDKLALDASLVANRNGRQWKTLADSTLDTLYMPGHPISWRDWQRREDYYPEGVLLWLDVDARLRELTRGTRGMDDFARIFFATHGNVETVSTYSFDDVCATLNGLARSDWGAFLNQHLLTHDGAEAVRGLGRAGWRLTYNSVPTEVFLQDEDEAGVTNLDTSLGMQIGLNGTVRSVVWNGAAFQAGFSPGLRIVSVNGVPVSRESLLQATSNSASIPLHLVVQDDDVRREVTVSYAGALRYPHIERVPGTLDWLSPLLTAR
jgi:predicted metalloprotease with PDZ domain